jgi:Family of unknown function (DUF5317)
VAGVWVLIIGAGLAVVVVLVTRGSPGQLFVALRSWWLLLVAAALLVGIGVVDVPDDRIDTIGFGVLMLAYAFILAFCLRNLRVRGMTIVTIGVAMNALVIGLNQGMPIDADERSVEESVFHRPEEETDLLPFLGEVVPLPDPFDEMVSFGDLVIAVGIVDAAYHASRRPARRRRPETTTSLTRGPVTTR